MKNLRLINFLKKWGGGESPFFSLKKFLKFYIILLLSCFFIQADQKELNKQLIIAIKKGDAQQVSNLLQQGANPNFRLRNEDTGQLGESPLQLSPTAEITRLLLNGGADAKDLGDVLSSPPLITANSLEQREALLQGGADPNIIHEVATSLMTVKSIEEADLLLNAGADPLLPIPTGHILPHLTALHRNKYVRQALAVSKKDDDVSFCEYVAEAQQVTSTRCGQRNLCMAEVVCVFRIGPTPAASLSIMNVELDVNFKPRNYKPKKYSYISRAYPVVCSALANGDCPPANECLLDRTFLQAETKTDDPPASSSPQSKTSKTGGMR